jgi:hypothetical protein
LAATVVLEPISPQRLPFALELPSMTFRFSRVRHLPRASVLGAAAALLVAACSSSDEPRDEGDPADELPPLGEAQLQLERAANCDDLLTRIQDSILVQLSGRADELKRGEDVYGNGRPDVDFGGTGGTGGVTPDAPPLGGPQATPGSATGDDGAESPTTPTNNGGTPAPSPTPPSAGPGDPEGEGGGFSGTTVQVKDVDEADIVKTDGDRIYLLHGGTLFVVAGWPASATEILGSTVIEGTPAEMFVKDGKAVVFSRVYGDLANQSMPADSYYYGYSGYTKLTVLDVAGSAPSVLRESFIEGDYNAARRHDDVVRAVVQDGFKIPQLGSPSIEYRDPFGQPYPQADIDAQVDAWLERTTRSIRNTDLGAWLPREFSRQNGSLVAVAPRCADYYSPDPGLTQSGVTSVVTLDLANVSAPLGGATVLGNAERVYSNEDVVLITQTDYRYSYDADATLQTIIHRFDIGGTDTTYTASGAVPGTIHDQFSLDERDGVIRVSATEQPWGRFGGWAMPGVALPTAPPALDIPTEPMGTGGAASTEPAEAPSMTTPDEPASDVDTAGDSEAEPPVDNFIDPMPAPLPPEPTPQVPTSVSRVLTLGVNGDSLEVLGSTDDFGASEQIFATRFMGDRAYVVTFRQTDPLFVIDLSDAADPHVVGELHIPGFSNYLFPLDDDHLFSIGRDATEQGVVQGLALQIFDVSDPAQPALAHRYVYPDAGDSPANVDHRAISFHPDRGVVAFPHTSWQTGESTLEVFQISSATGFARLGGMGMADELDVDQCIMKYFGLAEGPELDELRALVANDPAMQRDVLASCRYGHVFRRGLFRDDFVYGISNTGIYVYDITEMAAGAVSSLSLPAELYDYGSGTIGGGTSGGSASPGMAATPPVQVDPASAPTPASGGSAGAGGTGASAGGAGGASAGMEEADKAE